MILPRRVRIAITLSLGALSLVWLYEARTCGMCWFSWHVSPAVIIGNIVMAVIGIVNAAATHTLRKQAPPA